MSKTIYGIANHELDTTNLNLLFESLKKSFGESLKISNLSFSKNQLNSEVLMFQIDENLANYEFNKFHYVRVNSNKEEIGEIKLFKHVIVISGFYIGKYDNLIPLILSENWQNEFNIPEGYYSKSRIKLFQILNSLMNIISNVGGSKFIITSELVHDKLLMSSIIKGAKFGELRTLLTNESQPSFNHESYILEKTSNSKKLSLWVCFEQLTPHFKNEAEFRGVSPSSIIEFNNEKRPNYFYPRKPNELVKTKYRFGQTIVLKASKLFYDGLIDFWLSSQAWYNDGEDTLYEKLVFDDITGYKGWQSDLNRIGLCKFMNVEEGLKFKELLLELIGKVDIMNFMQMDSRWNNKKIIFSDRDNYYLYYFWTGE